MNACKFYWQILIVFVLISAGAPSMAEATPYWQTPSLGLTPSCWWDGVHPAPSQSRVWLYGGYNSCWISPYTGCYSYSSQNSAYNGSMAYVGIIDAQNTSLGGGAYGTVAQSGTVGSSNPLTIISGTQLQLDWACHDVQSVAYAATPGNGCYGASGPTPYYFADSAKVTAIDGSTLYSGSSIVGNTTVTPTGSPGANVSYTLACKRSSDNTTWTTTVPVRISAAVLSLVPAASVVVQGTATTLNWAATNATTASCKISNQSGAVLYQDGGSQNYTTAGTYTFTVPNFGSLTVSVAGGGGGGGGGSSSAYGTNGAAGSAGGSSIFASIAGSGGGGGGGGIYNYSSPGATGSNGSASGGDTNTSGGGAAGGAAGAGDHYSGCAGKGGCWDVYGGSGGTGGKGGQATKTYTTGGLTPGAGITVTVGGGGGGGSYAQYGNYYGATAGSAGAGGSVSIIYGSTSGTVNTGAIPSNTTYTLSCKDNYNNTVATSTTVASYPQCPNGSGPTGSCTACNAGYVLQGTAPTNSCVAACPNGSGPTGSCTACNAGYVLQGTAPTNSCVAACPANCPGATGAPNCTANSGYTYNSAGNTCTFNPVCPAPNCLGTYPSCVAGSGYAYNSSNNTCVVAIPSIVTFFSNQTRVRKNTPTSVTFSYLVTNPPASCTISGPAGFTPLTITPVDGVTGTQTATVNLSQISKFTFTCGAVTVQTTVGLVPNFQEI